MKKEFLYDTSLQEERASNQDALFLKRLKQKFYSILDNRHYATLHYRIRQGMRLYAIPNHRLTDNIPFLFQEEYRLQLWFPQILFHMGLQNFEAWKYNSSRYLSDTGELQFFFYNTFENTDSSQSVIIFEDIVHDLGGRERVRFFYGNTERYWTACLYCWFQTERMRSSLRLRCPISCRSRKTPVCISVFWTKRQTCTTHLPCKTPILKKKTFGCPPWLILTTSPGSYPLQKGARFIEQNTVPYTLLSKYQRAGRGKFKGEPRYAAR